MGKRDLEEIVTKPVLDLSEVEFGVQPTTGYVGPDGTVYRSKKEAVAASAYRRLATAWQAPISKVSRQSNGGYWQNPRFVDFGHAMASVEYDPDIFQAMIDLARYKKGSLMAHSTPHTFKAHASHRHFTTAEGAAAMSSAHSVLTKVFIPTELYWELVEIAKRTNVSFSRTVVNMAAIGVGLDKALEK